MAEDGSVHGRYNDLFSSASLRDVSYRCGSCEYELNLSSSNRNFSVTEAKYGKSMKKGIISFFSIDESRFIMDEELRCRPYFNSVHSWGLFQRRTKLSCRKCGSHIGNAHSLEPNSKTWNGISDVKVYIVKMRALQPSAYGDSHAVSVLDA